MIGSSMLTNIIKLLDDRIVAEIYNDANDNQ